MFLRRLSIRGFKSFADRTVFEFTPGIAVIVGPNGSGKSNLVDAIAWVLGEQGAKTLRGGKMEDVIFAGTPKRPALGRAEVELTIDNTSGTLPIDFTEVAISRTLFRTGESEYAINGITCRLLDIQELLSDSGIGRELHTIIGQGQLVDILAGRPEDRRAVIEEAAGLLKHRKRKDKAIRKLERVDADVERLTDITSELKRQIRPLERQADLAKQAAVLEEELRDLLLKIWLADYRAISEEQDSDAERRAIEEVDALTASTTDLGAKAEGLEAAVATAARAAEGSMANGFKLGALRERFAATARLADERSKHLSELAAREPRGEMPTEDEIQEAALATATSRDARIEAEEDARRAEADRAAVLAAREEAARLREEIVHLDGERAALRASIDGVDDERRRVQERRQTLETLIAATQRDQEAARSDLERLDRDETVLAERAETIDTRFTERSEAVDVLRRREREAERVVESLRTRHTILEEEIARLSDPATLLKNVDGIAGRVIDQVRAHDGFDRALLAALGSLADAVLAESRPQAMAALDALKANGGRAAIAVPGESIYDPTPAGVRALTSVIDGVGPHADLVRGLLRGIALAGSLAEAAELAHAHPRLVVVTADGDRVGPNIVTGGAPEDRRDPRLELRKVDEDLERGSEALGTLREELALAEAALAAVSSEVAEQDERMNVLDAEVAGATERLGLAEREAHANEREDALLAGRLAESEQRVLADTARLAEVEERLVRANAATPEIDPTMMAQIERAAAERSLQLGEAKERERGAVRALEALQQRARQVTTERERWETGRAAWEAGSVRAAQVADAARLLAERSAVWVQQAAAVHSANEGKRSQMELALTETRTRMREGVIALDDARRRAHESDLRRAERTHRLTAMVQTLRESYDLSPDEATQTVSVDPNMDEVRRRAATLERKLGLLGKINPIAMEQYESMVDRHAFLTEQVADLRTSRRDLMSVVDEVDGKIVEVFTEAFTDIAAEFAVVFARLFPGGQGNLVLTDPSDPLNSGVDVEARPPGKRVKRVSLLSGGERSMTAIALLFSVFRSRPSPFYLLDEVEAALDDVNLHRFLEVASEFRDRSQLLIVTHQKRTMEIGDAIYGISMAGAGISKVIAERLTTPVVDATDAALRQHSDADGTLDVGVDVAVDVVPVDPTRA